VPRRLLKYYGTLDVRLIWGIHSLTLIISWLRDNDNRALNFKSVSDFELVWFWNYSGDYSLHSVQLLLLMQICVSQPQNYNISNRKLKTKVKGKTLDSPDAEWIFERRSLRSHQGMYYTWSSLLLLSRTLSEEISGLLYLGSSCTICNVSGRPYSRSSFTISEWSQRKSLIRSKTSQFNLKNCVFITEKLRPCQIYRMKTMFTMY